MLKLCTDSLSPDRKEVWGKLSGFAGLGVLAGGTALALQLNHRRSYDFDIFSEKEIGRKLLLKAGEVFGTENIKPVVDSADELTVFYRQEIKISFVYFPFPPLYRPVATGSLPIFDIRDLLSNKAYAVGRRGAWRDYADIYWCLSRKIINLPDLLAESEKRFIGAFNRKLFLEQLVYSGDITDMTVDWVEKGADNEEIKKYFKNLVGQLLR